MASQTGRSLRLSKEGIEKANTALLKFGSKADLAAQLQMSRTTINKFFKGEPVQQKQFRAICKKLKLIVEEVADLPRAVEADHVEKNQQHSSDIEQLVQEVRSRCCDKVQHLYRKIQLLNRQQIDVDKLYVDVYVLEKLSSESHATIPDLLKGSDLRNDFDRLGLGSRQKRSPGFEVAAAAHYPRLMVLGKPGSGKSTFLRHLAVACCKGEFLADYIPILIELRFIKDASQFNLLNVIHQEFGLGDRRQTEQILNQGNVLILLDGLDEVPGQSRRDVQDHIYEFSQHQQYYKNRFILTCRTQTTEYISDKFQPVEVADFKPEQVEIFAQNWFAALAETPEQGAELKGQFIAKLRLLENKQTAELAVTPILLSLTCWVFNDLKALPPKRSDLYEQALNLLLKKWDEKRGVRRELGSEVYRKLSVAEKQKLLSDVAVRKFEQEQYVLFEQCEIQSYIAEHLGISAIDALIASDEKLREFLVWVSDKSRSVDLPYKAAAVRAFYLTLDLTLNGVLDPRFFLDLYHILNNFGFVRALDCTFDSTPFQTFNSTPFYRRFPIPGSMFILYEHRVDPIPDFLLVRELCRALDPSLILDLSLTHDNVRDLSSADLHALNPKLKQSLQQLQADLPNPSEPNIWNQWWETSSKAWAAQLREVMIEHCKIGYDRQFSEPQKELLKEYFDANKLLVDCLDSVYEVSDPVKEEIEETLLLPPLDKIE